MKNQMKYSMNNKIRTPGIPGVFFVGKFGDASTLICYIVKKNGRRY